MCAEGASPSSHSSFCEEVFSRSEPAWCIPESVSARRRTQMFTSGSSVTLANEVERSNILAPGLWFRIRGTLLLPAFTPERFRGLALGSRIQLQQRNCSRFARDFSRRSTFSSSQRTAVRISGLRSRTQDLFRTCLGRAATNRRPSATIEQSAVRAASCSAKAWRIASRFSATAIAPER